MFIFICQTHLVFGKCVCTCVRKHSNAFRTPLNWLKNLKCVWHEPKIHVLRLPHFGNCDLWAFGEFSFIRWSHPWNRACFPGWLSDTVRCRGHQTCLQVKRTSHLRIKRKLKSVWKSNAFKTRNAGCVWRCECKIANAKIYEVNVICTVYHFVDIFTLLILSLYDMIQNFVFGFLGIADHNVRNRCANNTWNIKLLWTTHVYYDLLVMLPFILSLVPTRTFSLYTHVHVQVNYL